MSTVLRELQINQNKPETRKINAGFTLKDRFVLEAIAGQGGIGTVYKARDKRKEEADIKNPFVAIKIVNEQYKEHPKVFQTLQMEAAKAQAIAHPNIVRIYDFDRDGDLAFITMEHLEGQTLKQMLQTNSVQHLSQTQKLTLISEIAAALIYMHQQGYAHADLKPSNIFITHNLQVKLIDFGFSSSALLPTSVTPEKENIVTYSPLYASYEVLNGNSPNSADDVYALACVTYELLTSKHPYEKKTAQQAHDKRLRVTPIPSLKKRPWRALEKALSIQRAKRYHNVAQFIDEFTDRKSWWKRLISF